MLGNWLAKGQLSVKVNQSNLSQANPHNPTLAIALLPPREGSNSPPATGHLLPEGTSPPQANSQVIGSQPTPVSQAIGNHHTPAIAHLPPGEGSNSPPATVTLPQKVTALPVTRHQVVFLVQQLLTFLPGKEAILPQQLYTLHQKATALPLSRHQAVFLVWQLLTFLPGEGSRSLPGVVHLPSEDVSSSQATSLHMHSEGNSSPQPPSTTQAGQGHKPPGQAGKVIGTPPGTGLHSLPRRPVQPPGRATPPPYPPVGPTKVLQMKNPTLSGSLTFPTNP